MKIKILLSCLITAALLSATQLFAQTEEYYRPDSLRGEQRERQEIPPVEKREVVEKKKDVDFKQLPFIDRLRLGGSFGLSFGTVTNVNLSPMAGYELTEKLVAGVGLTGMYFRSRYYNINTLYYGGRGFLMYNVFPMVNLVGEIEGMNVEASYQKRKWLASPLLGAAYSQPVGGRFIKAVHLTVLYNLSYHNQIDQYSGQNLSPYSSPFVFRVTFL
ncbi:hypothetical protein DSL64_10240 [Dyadobacter luteus]|jgi:hypothetical protein|uniref:Outer membrane protein beta-barrel domain-containing protein n=1 Tax=Dyadobacter luteus TaxID=2259619 RepID=A0A3D8YCB7_9BACT|nr:hypothetical protein [Dyadobacter luteus]REA62032.1 hypothetical protein DSL64_10240 [Dyadobacter luteus]